MTESTANQNGAAAERATVIEVAGLNVHIDTPDGEVHPVRGVDLTVHRGQIVGIVGESGCGKSTTVKGILKLLGPTSTVTAEKVRRIRHLAVRWLQAHPEHTPAPVRFDVVGVLRGRDGVVIRHLRNAF